MPRANRHHIPGQIWHITHRCHQGQFLFKFARDRDRWLYWLFEAKKRFGLTVLNYIVTSNHVHLLAVDDDSNSISRSIQIIAGRTAQEYNQRKKRKGAFWEDRYHATAIESGDHLMRCLTYIDMNMVRAGVVTHLSLWKQSGYHEIQSPPRRYRLIDRDKLVNLSGAKDVNQFITLHRHWIDQAIKEQQLQRMAEWTEAVAVGDMSFTEQIKQELGINAQGRHIAKVGDACELREPEIP